MKADDAPAHATSQIQWREKRFDFTLYCFVLFFTQLADRARAFWSDEIFSGRRVCFLHDEKAIFTPLFFFSRRWCLKKALKRHYTFSLLSSGLSSYLT